MHLWSRRTAVSFFCGVCRAPTYVFCAFYASASVRSTPPDPAGPVNLSPFRPFLQQSPSPVQDNPPTVQDRTWQDSNSPVVPAIPASQLRQCIITDPTPSCFGPASFIIHALDTQVRFSVPRTEKVRLRHPRGAALVAAHVEPH
jgi:hypothetical protein